MSKLIIFFLLLQLVGCASNYVKDYPRYSDYLAKTIEGQDKHISQEFVNEIPDMSKFNGLMAPGFSFSMSHPSDAKITGIFRSDFNGNLNLPYNVNINITGKTFAEVKEQALKAYRNFFQKGVENVAFTVYKKEYWVEVRGMVKKPGRYLVKSSDTLDLVINQAEGVQGDINIEYFSASLKQDNIEYQVLLNRYYESNDKQENIKWIGGDSVFISKMDGTQEGIHKEVPFVTILGGVARPGKILYQKDAGLFYYIDKSGGMSSGLSYQECYVFRATKDGLKKIKFSFDKPETMPVIYPNDTVYMNSQVTDPGDTWLDRISKIAGVITSIAILIIAL